MPNAENARLQYEAGQQSYPMSALTDSGDATLFTSAASLWSGRNGYAPEIRPDGLASGGAITPAASGTDDLVDVAALSCYLAGVKTAVAADTDVAITRPATAVAKINSITVNSSGAVAVVAGADGTTTAFSETRGGNGGPPFIPVGSVEIGQVRVTSNTDAPITAAQIFVVPGIHREEYGNPVWEVDTTTGSIEFSAALPLIHTGELPKGVYASYAAPIFSDVQLASDFTPPERSFSVNSTPYYGGALGGSSPSLGQGGFTAFLQDGISDPILQLTGENLWFKFFSNRYNTDRYILAQGVLAAATSFSASDNIQASCTISAQKEAMRVVA
jgi:hypothetical protein